MGSNLWKSDAVRFSSLIISFQMIKETERFARKADSLVTTDTEEAEGDGGSVICDVRYVMWDLRYAICDDHPCLGDQSYIQHLEGIALHLSYNPPLMACKMSRFKSSGYYFERYFLFLTNSICIEEFGNHYF